MLNPDRLRKRLIDAGIARTEQISGCSEDEIQVLEERRGLQLPEPYKEYLRCCGKGAGQFLRDVRMFWPGVLELNQEAREILDNWEDGQLALPSGAFVCGVRQGEQFVFFVCSDQTDDPVLFRYFEGDGRFTPIQRTFWQFLESELSMTETNRREYPEAFQ